MTEERKTQRTEKKCICGRNAELRIGTRQFFIGTRKIVLKNVPHFYCSYCDKASYDSSLNIDQVLRYAYKNNLNEIDWNNTSLYS